MNTQSPPSERRVLNLGSGNKRRPDALNVDIVSDTHPDIVHNLNALPWPMQSNAFEEVFANDVIEHLDDVVATMEQIHRVCRDGAVVRITVPHFSSGNAFTDPTHRHYFGRFSFSYFTGEHEFAFYTSCRFRARLTNIIFQPTLVNKLVRRMANRWPAEYERRWAWMFPAWFLYCELEVLKPQAPVERSQPVEE